MDNSTCQQFSNSTDFHDRNADTMKKFGTMGIARMIPTVPKMSQTLLPQEQLETSLFLQQFLGFWTKSVTEVEDASLAGRRSPDAASADRVRAAASARGGPHLGGLRRVH